MNQPNPNDPIDVLAKVGGYEIGGIAGLCLGAARYRIPVILDGVYFNGRRIDCQCDRAKGK